MKQIKVGDRIEIYEILSNISSHKGEWMPAIEPEFLAVAVFRYKWWTLSFYTEAIKLKELIECKKVGTLVITKIK